MQTLLYVLILVPLFGCASHVKRIDCEAQLKPINLPAPAASKSTPP